MSPDIVIYSIKYYGNSIPVLLLLLLLLLVVVVVVVVVVD